MKIKYDDEPEKSKRPCTFADVPVGGVFRNSLGGVALQRSSQYVARCVESGFSGVPYRFDETCPVTYYPDATLHMGRAVTEVDV